MKERESEVEASVNLMITYFIELTMFKKLRIKQWL